MAKTEQSHTALEKIALIAISICIVLVIIYQIQGVVDIAFAEATPTSVQPYTVSTYSSIPVEMEDVLPTLTPTPNQ